MSLVVDASVVTSALVADGPDGEWAISLLTAYPLVAPQLLPVEVANALRRAAARGAVSQDVASLAHADLMRLRVRLFSYAPLAERIWGLRGNLTAYDAWYVALAEALGAPLATLDRRLSKAKGPSCAFLLP